MKILLRQGLLMMIVSSQSWSVCIYEREGITSGKEANKHPSIWQMMLKWIIERLEPVPSLLFPYSRWYMSLGANELTSRQVSHLDSRGDQVKLETVRSNGLPSRYYGWFEMFEGNTKSYRKWYHESDENSKAGIKREWSWPRKNWGPRIAIVATIRVVDSRQEKYLVLCTLHAAQYWW